VFVCQWLDLSHNNLASLPAQLSTLGNLKGLLLQCNDLEVVPVSVLSGLTALTKVDLSQQHAPSEFDERNGETFQVSAPLLPILHPRLVKLCLRQRKPWDSVSLFHLGRAMTAVEKRNPYLTMLW
jgi:hypothetical protein